MALNVKSGNFAINTATGNQSISGLGFSPKLVLFFPTGRTSSGIEEDAHYSFGGMSASEQMVLTTNDEDGQATTDTHRRQTDTFCIWLSIPGTTTAIYRAEQVSLDIDGFTINVETAPASAYQIGYLAIGGDELIGVDFGSFAGAGVLGNQSVIGVGFEPNLILFPSTNSPNFPGANTQQSFMLGVAISSSERWVTSTFSQNGVATSNSLRKQLTDKCISGEVTTGTNEADFVSMDTDGFTINWTSTVSSPAIPYIALSGRFNVKLGSFNSQIGIGNFSESGIGFEPNSGIFTSFCNPTSAIQVNNAKMSLGAVTDLVDGFVAGGISEDNVGTSNTDNFFDNELIYQNYNFSQTEEGAIEFVSWDSDGFTLNQTNADLSQNEILYLLFGSTEVVFPTVKFSDRKPLLATPGLAEYKVRLKDQSSSVVAEFDTWRELSFTHKVNHVGSARIELNGQDSRVNLFELDGQLEIWRRNLIVDLDWYIEWEGFFRTQIDKYESDDDNPFIAKCLSYLDLARRAEIKYDAGSIYADKSAVGETAIKEYVSENIGVAALASNGRAFDNIMPGLTIEADGGLGTTWDGQRSNKQLLETLQKIALKTRIDFDVIGTGAAAFEFVTYNGQKTDRTKDNVDGNAPVVFSLGYGNMALPELTENREKEVTAAYALGKGVDNARQSALVESVASSDSPWNRIEKTFNAANTFGDNLESAADENLEDNKFDETFDFEILQQLSTYYGKHYTWGDLVSAEYKGRDFNKKVTEVSIDVSANVDGEKISVKVSDN
jgi:hypothetical protein